MPINVEHYAVKTCAFTEKPTKARLAIAVANRDKVVIKLQYLSGDTLEHDVDIEEVISLVNSVWCNPKTIIAESIRVTDHVHKSKYIKMYIENCDLTQ